jgi:hypothetical protein
MAQDVTALDEPKRLGALRSYEILDTQPEPAFDRLAKLAAVPIRPNPPAFPRDNHSLVTVAREAKEWIAAHTLKP